MKWKIPVICGVGALTIALGGNFGVWYSKSKQPVVEPIEISETIPEAVIPMPVVEKDITVPVVPSITPEDAAKLPFTDRPLGASWYEIYADILEDPTGYRRGIDYTPVVPFIHRAMEKGYLINRDWEIIRDEIDKVESAPEKERIVEAMKKARKKMREALK